MPSEHGEIRYDRPDFRDDCRRVAKYLDTYGRVSFAFAAFGTLHQMIAMDAKLLGSEDGLPTWIGRPPEGIGDPEDNSHTLWIRENAGGQGNMGMSAWLAQGHLHVPEYVAEKFTAHKNLADGTALAVCLLMIENCRCEEPMPHIRVRDLIKMWVGHARGTDGELPAFMEGDE